MHDVTRGDNYLDTRRNDEGHFECKDVFEVRAGNDLALLADVIEHVPDPAGFIKAAAERARYFAVGFAMDYNLANRLIKKRRAIVNRVGHISLFDEEMALKISSKFGVILGKKYIKNSFGRNFSIGSLRGAVTLFPRLLLQVLSPKWKGRIFGGETIYVFAQSSIYKGAEQKDLEREST